MSNLVIFDLDGVITSEEAYWDAAGLTLHELMYSSRYWNLDESCLVGGEYHPAASVGESRRVSRATLPEAEILALKARAINSNWDTCYAAVCRRLIDLLALLPDISPLMPLRPWDARWLTAFRKHRWSIVHAEERLPLSDTQLTIHLFDTPIFKEYIGLKLINRFDAYASEVLGQAIEDVFSRYSPFWAFCRDIFQEWYLGDDLYTETYGHAPAQRGKPGCIHFELPLLPLEEVRATLETLKQQGYVLGFATGRTYQEASFPLAMYGLLRYFDQEHVATYDYVERAEAEQRARGEQTLLSKPHPFQFLVALDSSYQSMEKRGKHVSRDSFIVVGDSTSDILGGRAAGALTVAVLTGARTPEALRLLEQSGPDFIIDDMTKLPEQLASIDSLATIQHLQFSEQEKAEQLLQRWFARHMHLHAESVTLSPKAVSLNSFNGFYHLHGEDFFFKTHVEEQGVLEEYYHAELLQRAGYNIVRPLQMLREQGRQMVIYPVVRWPVMFDLAHAVETGTSEEASSGRLLGAEKRECERLLSIYSATLARSTAEEHARAPVHQLFWHRLAGGRLKSFYEGKRIPFPSSNQSRNVETGKAFEELLKARWTINEHEYQETLGELIASARIALNPSHAAMTVTGHGDAHFGNIFLEDQKTYLYFDPAFAGRHTPLLDVIKPLYHNVFATWMYFPREVAQELQLSVTVRGTSIYVEHNYVLTPLRRALFDTKVEYLLKPLLALLRSQEALPANWMEIVRLALLCCPLLTVNLLDAERLPAAIAWLGLSQVIEMGHLSLPGGIEL